MRVYGMVSKILALVLTSGLLFSCNTLHRTPQVPEAPQVPGLTYITSEGSPAPTSIFWSPRDSTKILVNTHQLMTRKSSIYILDMISKDETMLVDTNGDIVASAWSPDGKHIALSVDGGTKEFPGGGLWVMNSEDNSRENIFDKYGAAFCLQNGNKLVILTAEEYASAHNSRRILIYLMDIQTKELDLIYSNEENVAITGFSSSPDGKYLVLSLSLNDEGGIEDLYLLDVQTGTMSQLTHDGVSSFPTWSPHGDLIAYEKLSTIGSELMSSLHIILPDGSCDIEAQNLNYVFSPTWSPDGKEIAFIGEDGVYILDTNIVFGRDIYEDLCP
jgi:Tol biopolymer transport system component